MTSWRDDQRFQCPDCGRLIYLTPTEPGEHTRAKCSVVAICIDCQHIFTSDEWRKVHVAHDPPDNRGPLPGSGS